MFLEAGAVVFKRRPIEKPYGSKAGVGIAVFYIPDFLQKAFSICPGNRYKSVSFPVGKNKVDPGDIIVKGVREFPAGSLKP